ncbi:putative reverse transcriptase domain-containing protein [Tanacetum coccineum]
MTTANEGMSVEEIEQIVAQRVANAIEAIAIYELINQTKQRENKDPVPRAKQRSVVSGKKAEVICYGCGGLGHYKSNCPIMKFQNRVDMYWKGKARGDSSATTSNINI